ncbi:alpha/beta hydrolase [Luteimonas sp. RC10]|uniref:alpha/beta hydrolase n=1 Tax=Luteimonas sp. RC10 TaxID=2587035 RepID=UPI0016154786|nr:alpha/beta hydrolase [Luteimonas sp. RC10]MBB3344594.1 pimeloyl-ACP methyl ester carboxylesterase [Luteimonas sp. RC10]
MTTSIRTLRVVLFVLATLFWLAPAVAQSDIRDQTVQVGDQTVRYLSAGAGDHAIVLLHGWPQSADAFKPILPTLAKTYRVYAPDLSGVGGSTAPRQRWDKASLATDIKAFVDHLGLDDPLIVGHDIGGMVAYAYARQYPDAVRGVAILDVPIPGLDPADAIAASPHAWHYDFHNQVGLAEALVQGRQAAYVRYFIRQVAANPDAIPDDAIAVYAKSYETPERLRAGFAFYRAFAEDAAFFQAQDARFAVPMLVVGGALSTGEALPVMTQSFAAHGATNITTLRVDGAGHWLMEEQPEATVRAIEDFAAIVFND